MKRARPDDSRTSASQNHLVFRTHLVKALVAVTEPDQPARRAPDVPSLQGSSSPYSPSHSLGKMPRRKRRCFQCAQDGVKMASGRTRETTSGCHLCNVHLHAGLSTCVWHGRTQTIKRERTTYYIDGAHTKESLEACTKWFKQKADIEKLNYGGSVVRILIFNTTGDRDVGLFLSLLKV
ncbi:hypothetical protein RRG08_003930 [Elysia crispata]|uniref:Folylpolyglutamate synthase n=1 Tax=Elysia crispata TaxID=231223 RepID=A0AAE0XT08_9GAST|nr:hypothetical protein RRG08_003930 [Elysia crispata]